MGTIIYEPSEKQQEKNAQLSDPLSASPTRGSGTQALPFPPPLLRIAASPHDSHLLATFSQDSNIIRVLDVRQPGQALLELKGHSASCSPQGLMIVACCCGTLLVPRAMRQQG